MKSIRRSIRKQLFVMMLGVAAGFALMILIVTLSQLNYQKDVIQERGQKEAQNLSEETSAVLSELNEQVARDFSGAAAKYFNTTFAEIRKHVGAIKKDVTALYKKGKVQGVMDDRVGLMKGVSAADVSDEFRMISPVRDFIRYLPGYDPEKISELDLYMVTESGMCLDGTGHKLGTDYADLRKEDWYKAVKKSGKTYWSGVFTGKVTGSVKVICAMPVYDKDKKFRGCVGGDVTVDSFQDMIEKFNEEQIISVVFFDQDNQFMRATNGYRDTDKVQSYLGKKDVAAAGNELYSFKKLEETGWTICLVLDQEKVRQTAENLQEDVQKNAEGIAGIVQDGIQKTILIFGISMAAGVVLVVIVTRLAAGIFVRPISQLIAQVRETGSGNLDQAIEVRTENEIGQLAMAFQDMTVELKNYMEHLQSMAASQERIATELNVARQIQMNMLPDRFPAFLDRADFDIYAVIHPVDEGGGNFYDFFLADKTHFCMVLGDVSGSGIPTTLFAVITKTHIKNYAQLGYQTDRILAETNNQLSRTNDAALTVSVFIGIIDLQTGVFQYTSAGQAAPLWKHSGKDLEFLPVKEYFALAHMENVPYGRQFVRLTQGDMLFLYTRGVSETEDGKGNEYTEEYLREYLSSVTKHQFALKDIADSIQADRERFSGGTQQNKDSTVMMFRYFGK